MENGGIHTERDYPYSGTDGGGCRSGSGAELSHKGAVVTIDGYEDVQPGSEAALKRAVARQPVAVAIQADQRVFQLYAGGVLDGQACGTQLDHGVLVAGYGHDEASGLEYW